MGKVLQLFDGLMNAVTGGGTSRDPRQHSRYYLKPALTQDEIAAAYQAGLMKKIIQIPPLDMVREWRDWKLETKDITAVEELEAKLDVRAKIRAVEVLRGLGGGALILGLPGDLASPAPDTTGKGALAFIHVVSRWHLSFDQLEDDARLPGYGEPRMWRLTASIGQQPIHPSRVIPFRGDTSASLALPSLAGADAFWGESKVAQVLDAVADNDTARASFAAMLHKARLSRIKIPKLMELVQTATGEATIQKRLAILAAAESMHNYTILDGGGDEGKGGEDIADITYNFAGAKDMLTNYAEFCSAISDIPATRLLGRAPEGMNSSGGSQQTDWNKLVMAMQTLDLAPCLARLDRFLVPSALGTTPEGTWYEWAPLDQPTQKEKADRWFVQTQAIEKLASTGFIPDEAMAKGVQSLMVDEGYMPELEQALEEIPEDERYGITPSEEDDLANPGAAKGGDQGQSAGEGGSEPVAEPPRRAANDTWFATDATPKPLYVQRKLINAADLISWAKAQGFKTTLPAEDMHVTVLYSRQAVDPMKLGETWTSEADGGLTIKPGGPRAVEKLGENAVVLLFASWSLTSRHNEMVEAGGSHDFPEYQPHVTLSYSAEGVDLEQVKPFTGELRFGPELFEPLDLDWKSKIGEV